MTKTQHIILYQFAGGKSIRQVCIGGVASYQEVKRWLTLPEELLSSPTFFEDNNTSNAHLTSLDQLGSEELQGSTLLGRGAGGEVDDCLEFRKHYNTILKNSIPLLIEELREDAEDLHLFTTTDKKDREDIPPAVWKKFKARLGVIKFLQSFFNTRLPLCGHSLRFTQKEAEYDEFNNPQSAIRNPQSGNPHSENPQSNNPQFSLDIELTPEEAEEFLGSPILLDDDYFERYPEHRQYAKWLDQPTKNAQSIDLKSAQSASLSAQISEKQNFAKLSANSAELCENPEFQSATDNIYLTTKGSNSQSAIKTESTQSASLSAQICEKPTPQPAIKQIRICPQYGNQCECSSEPNACGPAQYIDEVPEPEPPISNWQYQTPSPENGFYLKSGKFIFTNNTG